MKGSDLIDSAVRDAYRKANCRGYQQPSDYYILRSLRGMLKGKVVVDEAALRSYLIKDHPCEFVIKEILGSEKEASP
jgi:hypothetical protein